MVLVKKERKNRKKERKKEKKERKKERKEERKKERKKEKKKEAFPVYLLLLFSLLLPFSLPHFPFSSLSFWLLKTNLRSS